jgi:dTDP-3-amino-3,4,6-trideoxy-alpha-D-glucose transaminase
MRMQTNGTPAIPLTRMDRADPALMEELLEAVERVARSGAFTGGGEVDAFEREFADYCGTRHAVGLSSGTEALALALRALDIGPGDEVIVPANSFIATAEAVTLVGATPRFVDVDGSSALVTVAHVAPAIGPRTRAVIPVHLYGRTVALAPIVALARRAGIAVIEDACQAHGAWVAPGRRAGSVGDCGAFSFYPAKNLGAWGDAGGLVTNDDEIADRVRLLRSHGERPRYHHLVPGTTARLDAIQAAVLRIKLRRLDAWNGTRRRIAATLSDALAGAPVGRPLPVTTGDHVHHQFVVRTAEREALRHHLGRAGISTGVHYPVAIHRSPAYRSAGLGPHSLPVAETLAETVCSLPMHPSLTREEIGRVAAAVHAFGESVPVSRAA